MISSPQLLIPGTVNLDSDEETEETINAYFKGSKDSSLSSENMEIVIKVKYTSKIEDYMLRPVSTKAQIIIVKWFTFEVLALIHIRGYYEFFCGRATFT